MFYKQTLHTLLTLLLVVSFSACSSKSKKSPAPSTTTTNTPTPRNNPDINHTALILAVHDYAGDNNDLDGIDIDEQKMHTLFKSWAFNVEVLTRPMRLEEKLNALANTLKAEDVFIFYYSGHGTSTPDTTHDELDGMDELIVLSDSDTNLFLLDDKINLMLNKIKARKLIIFDSCNSGTALKSTRGDTLNPDNTQVKFMLAPKDIGDNSPQNSQVPNTSTQGTYLYFAACKDSEESLASDRGSLYTNAFKSGIILNQSANTLLNKTRQNLRNRFTPQLSASEESLKNISLKQYLKLVY